MSVSFRIKLCLKISSSYSIFISRSDFISIICVVRITSMVEAESTGVLAMVETTVKGAVSITEEALADSIFILPRIESGIEPGVATDAISTSFSMLVFACGLKTCYVECILAIFERCPMLSNFLNLEGFGFLTGLGSLRKSVSSLIDIAL